MIYSTTTNCSQRRWLTACHKDATSMFLLFLFLFGIGIAPRANGQTVSHPLSELSTSIKHYSYTDMLSSTQKKELEYIIVKASNGDVKTVFNACDVCYPAHKGYSQSGNQLRCNNCGKYFRIDTLGNQPPPGTCSPGYLPHAIQGDEVVINISDLKKGEYFFETQTVSAVDNPAAKPSIMLLAGKNGQLTVRMANDAHRTLHVITINGQLRRSVQSSASVVQINTSGLSSGAYLLAIEEAGKTSSQFFLVY
jgi:hypothetical protein